MNMLPSLVHSPSLKVKDHDHDLEEFEECAVGYQHHGKSGSLRFVQEACCQSRTRVTNNKGNIICDSLILSDGNVGDFVSRTISTALSQAASFLNCYFWYGL